MKRETKYAKSEGLNIAYQVIGHGDLDLVFVMGWVSHIEYFWHEPHFARFLERLASFSRLILFDKRGTGLSDRPVGLPTLEQRMDDVRAVMDAVGSERAALFGVSEGGPMSALFAATYPDRTRAIVMDGAYARSMRAPDYPFGKSVERRDRYFQYLEENWGGDVMIHARAPSLSGDPEFREWWSTYLRMSASPGAAVAFSRMNWQIDIRHVLPTIQVPTLVMHRGGDAAMSVENGRYLAKHIPGARYVEFPGSDHLPFSGDQDAILDEVERFLTGTTGPVEPRRTLVTLLCAEIVGAMGVAARMGDRKWAVVLATHNTKVRSLLEQHRGRVVRTSMAGFVAAFDGPARAIRCAAAIADQIRETGIEIRAGVHTGECELVDGELGGVAVQIASRVMSRANVGEVVVSSTVVDLVAGSGVNFARLEHGLATGAGHTLDLYRVVDAFGGLDRVAIDPGATPEGQIPLSPRELEVAILIGRGLSNRLIASELSISVATVERHAANIFNKMGLRSRTQVAAWVANEGLLRTQAR